MIAYVVNQYPKVSHSFIRREILALESLGTQVSRFAMRGWDADLVDSDDIAERGQTFYLLQGGLRPLLRSGIKRLTRTPGRFFSALKQTWRMIRRSDRTTFLHVITLLEACLLADRASAAGVRHFHAHFGTNSTEVTMLASLLSGIPYSFTVHGPDEFDKPEFINLRDKAHHAKFIVAITTFCASQLYRWIDFADWDKVRIVRCGIDQSFFASDETAPPSHPNRLVCVGRLSAQKGHVLLIKAVARVIRAGGTLELELVGDGELRDAVEALIRAEGIEHAVHITGWVSSDGVRERILAGRGLVLTSFAEGLPVVIMEAMALGRVVLSTQIAAIPELVQTGTTGWLFSAGSVEAAADALTACLAASPDTLAEMGRQGRALVKARHDQQREAAYLLTLFNDPANALSERSTP